jgi:hypothetical protein
MIRKEIDLTKVWQIKHILRLGSVQNEDFDPLSFSKLKEGEYSQKVEPKSVLEDFDALSFPKLNPPSRSSMEGTKMGMLIMSLGPVHYLFGRG